MSRLPKESLFTRHVKRRSLSLWKAAARQADQMSFPELTAARLEARTLRRHLNELIHVADGRLQLPRIGHDTVPNPPGSDWTWRPQLWRGPVSPDGVAAAPTRTRLGHELTLFHDCPTPEIILRQTRNRSEGDLAPYGLDLEVFRFGGSFLSFVLDLPDTAITGLRLNHLVRMEMALRSERPIEIFCRLNIQYGPNSEQLVREIPRGSTETHVEFDLAYTRMNENRLVKAWVDIIFGGVEMNRIELRDLTFARYPRAEL